MSGPISTRRKTDNKAAIELPTPTVQDSLAVEIDRIMAKASVIVATSSPMLVSDAYDIADYLVGRLIDGQRFIFAIRFIRWEDGTWKLESM